MNVIREDEFTEEEEVMMMKQPEQFWKAKVKEKVCFECGDPGHYKRDCPKLPPKTETTVTKLTTEEVNKLKKDIEAIQKKLLTGGAPGQGN